MEKTLFKIEVCTAGIGSAVAAQRGGAHRIELCDNLYEGGTTPSFAMIKIARELLKIDLHVMIRPRGGDFYYSDAEMKIMFEDIKTCGELGADGVVLGCLKLDGTVNIPRTKQLVEYAWPMSVTFHRAFDLTPDPLAAMEDIIDSGCDRILTSGQRDNVMEGAPLIKKLIEKADKRIIIMPGSGLNENNIIDLKKNTGAREYHLTGKKTIPSPMLFRKKEVKMGSIKEISPYNLVVTDEVLISSIVEKVNQHK